MDKIHLGLKQMGLLLVVTPVLLSLIFTGVLAVLIFNAERDYDEQLQSTILAMRLYESEQHLADAFCQIVSRLDTEDPQFEAECNDVAAKLKLAIDGLNEWYEVRFIEQKTIKELQEICRECISLVRNAQEVFRDKNIEPKNRHKHLDAQLQKVLFSGQSLVTELTNFEDNVKLNLANILFQRGSLLWICLYGGLLLSACFSVSLAVVFSKNVTDRLDIVHKNAELLAIGKPVTDKLEGDDELSRLNDVLIESSVILSNLKQKELTILNQADEVLCSLDPSLRFTTIGAASGKLWGKEASELIASPIANLIAPADRDRVIEKFQKLLKEKTESNIEFRIRKNEDEYVHTLWLVTWNSKTNRVYCVARDITARVELEKSKQRFLSSVSHDLRTPLSSIMHSFNLVLDSEQTSEKIKKMLERTKTSMTRLLRLVEELLEIDKLESGKLTVEPAFVSSYDVCMEALDAVEWFATSRIIKIKHDLEDLAILGDEKRLIQVLINLLSNAIKFSPSESTVTVTVSRTGNYAKFGIRDQGPGISEEDKQTVFERYTQAKSSGAGAIKGTGLGLSICSAIVKAHDGKIGVESEIGKGSTFWLEIPLIQNGGEDIGS